MRSLLCETVTGRTTADLVAARDAAFGVDMVELRVDGVTDLDVARLLLNRKLPVIVTCRPQWEGGHFTGTEQDRRRILARALELDADYVDIEWRSLRHHQGNAGFDELIEEDGLRVVLSLHDFGGVPDDLGVRAHAMSETGAGVIKIAVTPSKLTDMLPLLDIARKGNAVVIGMGGTGLPSRLLASRFGSLWTYGGNAVAPGQIPASRMLNEFRFRAIGPETVLYGVAGPDAIDSPIVGAQNAGFAAASIDAVCIPLPTVDAGDAEQFADALGIRLEPATNYQLPTTD
jgi:3-dehydroquinate dehydratase type I